MTESQKEKCHYIIHGAAMAAGGIAALPIPIADIGPITAIQATMIISLARVFEIPITENLAKETAKTFMVGQIGKQIAASLSKIIPIIGSGVNATVAVGLTETLGWETAEDFYRKSQKMSS